MRAPIVLTMSGFILTILVFLLNFEIAMADSFLEEANMGALKSKSFSVLLQKASQEFDWDMVVLKMNGSLCRSTVDGQTTCAMEPHARPETNLSEAMSVRDFGDRLRSMIPRLPSDSKDEFNIRLSRYRSYLNNARLSQVVKSVERDLDSRDFILKQIALICPGEEVKPPSEINCPKIDLRAFNKTVVPPKGQENSQVIDDVVFLDGRIRDFINRLKFFGELKAGDFVSTDEVDRATMSLFVASAQILLSDRRRTMDFVQVPGPAKPLPDSYMSKQFIFSSDRRPVAFCHEDPQIGSRERKVEVQTSLLTQGQWWQIMGNNPSSKSSEADCPNSYLEIYDHSSTAGICPNLPALNLSLGQISELLGRLNQKKKTFEGPDGEKYHFEFRILRASEWHYLISENVGLSQDNQIRVGVTDIATLREKCAPQARSRRGSKADAWGVHDLCAYGVNEILLGYSLGCAGPANFLTLARYKGEGTPVYSPIDGRNFDTRGGTICRDPAVGRCLLSNFYVSPSPEVKRFDYPMAVHPDSIEINQGIGSDTGFRLVRIWQKGL